ncbi:hypothetical protein ACPB9E_29280 [Streptomyces exfoliatus]|uniref:hypothetical protein n=1 Tax=Streptomyces exfoliatus TaxID=1905 RepID=UPI003C2F8D68
MTTDARGITDQTFTAPDFFDATLYEPVFPERVLAAVRPDRRLDLGDVVTWVEPCFELQNLGPGECFVLLADLLPLADGSGGIPHRSLVEDTVRSILALGIDPERCVIYRQSDVPHVFELMWILAHHLGGDGADGHGAEGAPEPLLRAAEILGIRATRVVTDPAPESQRGPRLARSLARRLNARYGAALLPVPASDPLPVLADEATVRAGREPTRSREAGVLERVAESRERYGWLAAQRTLPSEILAEGARRARGEAAEAVAVIKEAVARGDRAEDGREARA